jgi:hypothetical protein
VVVRDFNFVCITILPAKAHTILVVDPNAVLAGAVPAQPLKSIARWDCQLRKLAHSIELVKLAACNRPQYFRASAARRPRFATVKYVLGSAIGERAYHGPDYNDFSVFGSTSNQAACRDFANS